MGRAEGHATRHPHAAIGIGELDDGGKGAVDTQLDGARAAPASAPSAC